MPCPSDDRHENIAYRLTRLPSKRGRASNPDWIFCGENRERSSLRHRTQTCQKWTRLDSLTLRVGGTRRAAFPLLSQAFSCMLRRQGSLQQIQDLDCCSARLEGRHPLIGCGWQCGRVCTTLDELLGGCLVRSVKHLNQTSTEGHTLSFLLKSSITPARIQPRFTGDDKGLCSEARLFC